MLPLISLACGPAGSRDLAEGVYRNEETGTSLYSKPWG